MTETEADKEITREEALAHPELCSDPTQVSKGVLDDAIPDFEEHVLHIYEAVVLESHSSEAAAGSSITDHQRRALRLALVQRGPRGGQVQRDPSVKDKNRYSKWFGFGPQFWCADFVAFCVDRSGNHDKKVPWGYPSAVRNITAWGKKHGKIHSMPKKGDIFTYKNGGHTGLVLSAHGSSFITVEGNTGPPAGTSSPSGSVWVASHSRDASDGMYFFVGWDF